MKGDHMKTGQQVKVRGLNMKMVPTIEISRIVEILPSVKECPPSPVTGHVTKYDCVIEHNGIKMFADSRDFIGE